MGGHRFQSPYECRMIFLSMPQCTADIEQFLNQ